MAFYIRKAFKTGPVRLNLSKGGLGLSAGVTGARVGINSKGTYVHGGRHGLYYRKYVNRQGGRKPKQKSTTGRNRSGPVDLFYDTGVTFPNKAKTTIEGSKSTVPDLPDLKLFTTPFLVTAAFLGIFLIVALGEQWLLNAAIIGWGLFIPVFIYNGYWLYRSKTVLRNTIERSDKTGDLPESLKETIQSLPDQWQSKVSLHLHAVIGEMAMRSENIDTREVFKALDRCCPADSRQIKKIRADILASVLDEMLEDHFLGKEEENAIQQLVGDIGINRDFINREMGLIEYFGNMRREMERPLEPVEPGIPLVRGEEAYEVFEPARLLKERVLNRFQRDNVQYREIGYDIDMEGKLVLTDRRVMLIERGTREYRLNRVVNVTSDPEAGIVELTLSNRKNPVLITVEQPLLLAVRIETIIREKVA